MGTPYKMVPEVKAKWVAALRSGEYEQGKAVLSSEAWHDGEWTYCCLGVLRCVAPELVRGNEDNTELTDEDRHNVRLQKKHMEQLIRYNDGESAAGVPMEPWPFARIADWVERML